jgi:signal transduction histidine kinase
MQSSVGPALVPPPESADVRRGGASACSGSRLRTDYTDLQEDYRLLLCRHERVAWSVVLVVIILYAVFDLGSELLPLDPAARVLWRLGLLAALGVGAVALSCRVLLHQAAAQLRVQQAARAAQDEAARLEGALLAARTMQHHLSNQLALTRGYTELLARSPELPDAERESAQEALRGVLGAMKALDELRGITRLETDEHLKGPAVLDLGRSRGAAPN